MIFEDLQAEIDQKANKLVIDKVASLLADPYKWDQLFSLLDKVDFASKIDPESEVAIRLRYVAALRKYVADKIALAKASRMANHFDWPESQTLYRLLTIAERNFEISKWNKTQARNDMTFYGFDYKEYHNNATTRFY